MLLLTGCKLQSMEEADNALSVPEDFKQLKK